MTETCGAEYIGCDNYVCDLPPNHTPPHQQGWEEAAENETGEVVVVVQWWPSDWSQ